MKDYRGVDVSTLTYEDAKADGDWGKVPYDYFAFLAIDADFLESVRDFEDSELVEVIRATADFCVSGTEPHYAQMSTTAVKSTVRRFVAAHKKRLEAEYLKHYKQFVSAKKKQQEQAELK